MRSAVSRSGRAAAAAQQPHLGASAGRRELRRWLLQPGGGGRRADARPARIWASPIAWRCGMSGSGADLERAGERLSIETPAHGAAAAARETLIGAKVIPGERPTWAARFFVGRAGYSCIRDRSFVDGSPACRRSVCHAGRFRSVSGENSVTQSWSTFRPNFAAAVARRRFWASLRRTRLLPSFSRRTRFSSCRVRDHVLLLPVDEAGQSHEEKVPGVTKHAMKRPPPAKQPDTKGGLSSLRGIIRPWGVELPPPRAGRRGGRQFAGRNTTRQGDCLGGDERFESSEDQGGGNCSVSTLA